MFLFLVFSQRKCTVVMQSLAYLQHSSPVAGAKLFISGDLKLQQKTPLPHRGLYDIYNVSGHQHLVFIHFYLCPPLLSLAFVFPFGPGLLLLLFSENKQRRGTFLCMKSTAASTLRAFPPRY